MAAAAKKAAIISSLPVVGGIIFCGVILLFIAIVGLYGAFKQHQIALFAYMVVLFSIFVIQFSVACASLAASTTDELDILGKVSYFYFLKFSAVCAVLLIQLPPFTFTRLLDSPYENEVTLSGQNPPLKYCQYLEIQYTVRKKSRSFNAKNFGSVV